MAVGNLTSNRVIFWSLAILMGAIIVRSIVAPTKDERIVVEGTKVHVEPLEHAQLALEKYKE